MPLQKQNLSVTFAGGLDTKTDPLQVAPGKFLNLVNSFFDKGALLTKRNGFVPTTTLPVAATTISTYKDGLVAVGSTLQAFNQDSNQWVSTGNITPISLDVTPLVRTSTSQTSIDVAVASNGLSCSVWLDANGTSYYQVSNSLTGQIVVAQTALEASSVLARVFALGNYLMITYLNNAAGVHLKYVAIPIYNPSSPTAATDISTVVESITAGYDGCVANTRLYLAYSASDGGGAVRVTSIGATLAQGNTIALAGHVASRVSVTADTSGSNSIIWVTYLETTVNDVYTTALSSALVSVLAQTRIYVATAINNITSCATGNVLTVFTDVPGTYSYTPNAVTNHVSKKTVTLAGTIGSVSVIQAGVGLGSKSFFIGTTMYMLMTYGQAYQPTYFMIDSSGNIVGKLAYSNGGGYITTQILPGVSISGDIASIGYLFVDLLVPVNKTQGVTKISGVYTQTGINICAFNFSTVASTVEIGSAMHITGGFLSMFDGIKPVEHGFHVWPEDIAIATSAAGGLLTDQTYFYVATYEWTDAQGNIHRSAPSVPVTKVTAGGNTSTNTINVPMLRLTAKSNVRIVLYRWSTAQQSYYQVSTVASPNVNVPTSNSIAITDTLADSSILGNALLYTTGGVIEDIAAPATDVFTLYKSRLFLLNSENRNQIWFSKQVIEATPVEMSDLLSIYVAPTLGSQGSTGPITALSNMDDKLIIFKGNAIYYITGQGPDNTGAQNDFSDPVFITSTAGTTNPKSIVSTPNGLMFQSNKGIWILKRDMSTEYIGAPVEAFNSKIVNSATTIPGTNQVRFTLQDEIDCLVYDYYFQQWGTFTNIRAVASTIYQSLHTYLNTGGSIVQETPGLYLDGSVPVALSFTTGWMSLAGLQGYERLYEVTLLGNYISPHLLHIGLSYDYNSSQTQTIVINPDNYTPSYGDDSLYGGEETYSVGTVEQWRLFPERQKCQSFQISLTETYDPSLGVDAGAGFTMSGMNLVMGAKKGYAPKAAAQSAG
jgi:hypothetical protein